MNCDVCWAKDGEEIFGVLMKQVVKVSSTEYDWIVRERCDVTKLSLFLLY
jgi:hypothetical protein